MDCVHADLDRGILECLGFGGVSWVLFEREGSAFVLSGSGLYSGAPPEFPVLESEELWEALADRGWYCSPGGAVVAVDDAHEPHYLLLLDDDSCSVEGPALRFLLVSHLREEALRKRWQAKAALQNDRSDGSILWTDGGASVPANAFADVAAMDAGYPMVSLPVWHKKNLEALSQMRSPLLILGEPGSAIDELVQYHVMTRGGGMENGIFFHPGRLAPAVQLRELFGDPAGVRLGGRGASVSAVERSGASVAIHEVGQLADLVQLRLLNLFASERTDQSWIFLSSQDLASMVEAGEFQEGLYRVLEKNALVVSPVRHHRDLLPREVERLLNEFRVISRRRVSISDDAISAILQYDWPGNYSELRKTLESAFYLCVSGEIEKRDLRLGAYSDAASREDDLDLRRSTRDLEERIILRAHALHGGNQMQMARALGISRGSLQYKLEKLGLG